ncbi:MAG TPA: PAS domain-containing protein, partial [Bacteroidales bacterium]|nr:PAS domain-containing protein [Bacteroidales bacterium]
MDYKAGYEELLRINEQLSKENFELRRNGNGKNEICREITFRFLHCSSCLMAITNLTTGEFVDVNESFLSNLGYQRQEVIGKSTDDIQFFADLDESKKYLRLISGLKKVKDYPVTIRTRSGEKRQFIFTAETVTIDN